MEGKKEERNNVRCEWDFLKKGNKSTPGTGKG